jgi:hypothetical protein
MLSEEKHLPKMQGCILKEILPREKLLRMTGFNQDDTSSFKKLHSGLKLVISSSFL